MSEEQLSVLLAKLKEDSSLREKLQVAGDIDTFIAMAKEAGFDVSKADWLKYQAKAKEVELSDEELEGVTGGVVGPAIVVVGTYVWDCWNTGKGAGC
jgi:predicted ribosomally synthesized peptide with nif11-like leader